MSSNGYYTITCGVSALQKCMRRALFALRKNYVTNIFELGISKWTYNRRDLDIEGTSKCIQVTRASSTSLLLVKSANVRQNGQIATNFVPFSAPHSSELTKSHNILSNCIQNYIR